MVSGAPNVISKGSYMISRGSYITSGDTNIFSGRSNTFSKRVNTISEGINILSGGIYKVSKGINIGILTKNALSERKNKISIINLFSQRLINYLALLFSEGSILQHVV